MVVSLNCSAMLFVACSASFLIEDKGLAEGRFGLMRALNVEKDGIIRDVRIRKPEHRGLDFLLDLLIDH